MIDITKDEFWEAKYETKIKDNHRNLLKILMSRYKLITIGLICLVICMSINVVLIYNFMKVLTNLSI